MNYKETLYFVAKSLTISLDDKNRQGIEKQLRSSSIDWDTVVKVSTSHYVFPALYCNLQRAGLSNFLSATKDLYKSSYVVMTFSISELALASCK